jgi:N6-L-threonylcarbamoyladenine synthase
LPRPLKGRPGYDFSFSGLKTAVRQLAEELRGAGALGEQDKADICAGFQTAATEVICARSRAAMLHCKSRLTRTGGARFVVAGGVAANRFLRTELEQSARDCGFELFFPPLSLCTDNGAMIAWAGIERLALGYTDGLDAPAKARWPL